MTILVAFIFVQCRAYLDPVEVVKEDPDDGMKKIYFSIDIFNFFKKVIEAYRTNVKQSCEEQNVEPSEWVFHSSWVFGRVDAFLHRLREIKVFVHRFGAQFKVMINP